MRLYILFLLDTAFGWQTLLSPEQLKKNGILPWIGVLTIRSGDNEFATGLTLIAERLAAANSNDISKLDKKTFRMSTKAIFFTHNVPWYCDVIDYNIHPEFNNLNLINTLAVLHLDCDRQNWTPINWPIHSFKKQSKTKSQVWRNIYAIGLSDGNYNFEQIMFGMKFVNSSKCFDFYAKEEIDFKSLWPKYFFCLKAVDVKRQCVFDSGMALVSLNNGNWTLIGISIHGPGCLLPSRYIDIFPYVTWMHEQKYKHMLSYRRQQNDDEDEDQNTTAIDPSKDIVDDVSNIEDVFFIKQLNETSMVLRPRNATRDIVYGNCHNIDGEVIYRDAGVVRSSSNRPATGIYALSLYDLFYDEITCVMINVVCEQYSFTKFWFDYGFKADSWSDLIKVVPYKKLRQTVPPKILYLTDTYYNYEQILTANLVFKFMFAVEAAINVDFYGKRNYSPRRATATTTTYRTPKKHPYHLETTQPYKYEPTLPPTTTTPPPPPPPPSRPPSITPPTGLHRHPPPPPLKYISRRKRPANKIFSNKKNRFIFEML